MTIKFPTTIPAALPPPPTRLAPALPKPLPVTPRPTDLSTFERPAARPARLPVLATPLSPNGSLNPRPLGIVPERPGTPGPLFTDQRPPTGIVPEGVIPGAPCPHHCPTDLVPEGIPGAPGIEGRRPPIGIIPREGIPGAPGIEGRRPPIGIIPREGIPGAPGIEGRRPPIGIVPEGVIPGAPGIEHCPTGIVPDGRIPSLPGVTSRD